MSCDDVSLPDCDDHEQDYEVNIFFFSFLTGRTFVLVEKKGLNTTFGLKVSFVHFSHKYFGFDTFSCNFCPFWQPESMKQLPNGLAGKTEKLLFPPELKIC